MFRPDGYFQSVKGVSNLVSAVILIVFVVTLGVIVTNWGQKIIGGGIEKSQTKVGTSLECGNIQVRLEENPGGTDTLNLILNNNNKNNLKLEGLL